MEVTLSLSVFIFTYVLIMSEKVHRAIAALLGGAILIGLNVLSQEKAIEYIDWNTLGLLIGMMIIVGITRRTGLFQYLALTAVHLAKGEPIKILIALATVTAIVSAFLDNVTTVLLIGPITFTIADSLGVNPIPFLISQILASNIGGTATLIGDPPNIMIGSKAGLGFMDFIIHLAPVIVIIYLAIMTIFYVYYRSRLNVTDEVKAAICKVNPQNELKDSVLLKKCLIILGLTIVGFILHQWIHLESATIAVFGAVTLMLVTKEEPEDILLAVEWPSIFFFLGLFIIVGGLVQTGFIARLAQWTLNMTAGNLRLASIVILWVSALASAFVDNIPYVATVIPMIQQMGHLGGISPSELQPLWWALSLGACLGGNGTLIGASANVVLAGIAEKNGFNISFRYFLKIAFPLMILSVLISMIYLLVFLGH
jgi:Na+/H+ antiporter NhaD/arsenite permease-like protein